MKKKEGYTEKELDSIIEDTLSNSELSIPQVAFKRGLYTFVSNDRIVIGGEGFFKDFDQAVKKEVKRILDDETFRR